MTRIVLLLGAIALGFPAYIFDSRTAAGVAACAVVVVIGMTLEPGEHQ